MDKTLRNILILGILIISFSIAFHYLYYIPYKDGVSITTQKENKDTFGGDNESIEIKGNQIQKIELSKNPEYLLNKNFSANNVTLNGVSFGDNVNKIPIDLIESRTESAGWIHTKNAGYRIANNRVVEFVVRNEIVNSLGILRKDEMEFRFGKPDKIEEDDSFISQLDYYYFDRGLIIRWVNDAISIINIIK